MNQFFIYGSKIRYLQKERGVYFQNLLFAPGSVIAQWKSSIDFQTARSVLQLPLLKRGERYRVACRIETIPANAVFIQISFYDRSEVLLGTEVISMKGGDFTYLLDAYSYTLEIINMGVQHLLFEHLLLTDEKEWINH